MVILAFAFPRPIYGEYDAFHLSASFLARIFVKAFASIANMPLHDLTTEVKSRLFWWQFYMRFGFFFRSLSRRTVSGAIFLDINISLSVDVTAASTMTLFPGWKKPVMRMSPFVLRMIAVPSSWVGDLGVLVGDLEGDAATLESMLWIYGSSRTLDFPCATAHRCSSSCLTSYNVWRWWGLL